MDLGLLDLSLLDRRYLWAHLRSHRYPNASALELVGFQDALRLERRLLHVDLLRSRGHKPYRSSRHKTIWRHKFLRSSRRKFLLRNELLWPSRHKTNWRHKFLRSSRGKFLWGNDLFWSSKHGLLRKHRILRLS